MDALPFKNYPEHGEKPIKLGKICHLLPAPTYYPCGPATTKGKTKSEHHAHTYSHNSS
jgi:hypothetical protein